MIELNNLPYLQCSESLLAAETTPWITASQIGSSAFCAYSVYLQRQKVETLNYTALQRGSCYHQRLPIKSTILQRLFQRRKPTAPQKIIPELGLPYTQLIYHPQSAFRFTSKLYHLSAKPDYIFQLADGQYVLVEYKSRHGKVKYSDKQQLIATALAVKETYPKLCRGYVYTEGNDAQLIDLTIAHAALATEISRELISARLSALGQEPPVTPKRAQCNACGYQKVCSKRVKI